MTKEEIAERWERYFVLYLDSEDSPKEAADLADDALMEWRTRYDPEWLQVRPSEPQELKELPLRNLESSLPPNGSMFYTRMKDEDADRVVSGCCGARIDIAPGGEYPICSKCDKPVGA